jgi:hypothetical protein
MPVILTSQEAETSKDHGSMQVWENSWWDPILKKPITKKKYVSPYNVLNCQHMSLALTGNSGAHY